VRSKTTHDRGCRWLRAVLLLPRIASFIVIPLCSETAFFFQFYFPLSALGLCNVEKLSQFAQMRDGQTRLNSQRIQWEVTAINSANFESKTRGANNVEAVR
jgi:hypothetical protein